MNDKSKTFVVIAHGPGKGRVGWINGDLRPMTGAPLIYKHMVHFPDPFPDDLRQINRSRLRHATPAEIMWFGEREKANV